MPTGAFSPYAVEGIEGVAVGMGRVREEGGATLVEFAILMPLLLVLILGIVELGWAFAQYQDVRHGAREGARLAAVNFPEGDDPPGTTRTQANTAALLSETCARMGLVFDGAVVFQGNGSAGDEITVTATAPAGSLSGFLDWAFPDSLVLRSSVSLRSEQPATWANTDLGLYPNGQPCP